LRPYIYDRLTADRSCGFFMVCLVSEAEIVASIHPQHTLILLYPVSSVKTP